MNALLEAYFFYDIKRFDIKGKEFLRTLGKYYIVDIGLRNYLLGFRNRDSGHAIENVVYFELAMMLLSARSALPRSISLQPRPMKSCMCR